MIELKHARALKKQLFSGNAATVFAILDGASVPGLPATLFSYSPGYQCLYRGDLKPDMAEVAPYLAILERDAPFTEWVLLTGWGKHWGIFGDAHADLPTLKRHFRKFLTVYDDSGKGVYFRFYDPRVWRNYLPTCHSDQLKTLFGPVNSFLVEGVKPDSARKFLLLADRLQQKTVSLFDLKEREEKFFVPVSEPEGLGEVARGNGRIVIRPGQSSRVGESIYVERMRSFLNEYFPESKEVAPEAMGQTIVELTERAALYKLILETHVAPFIVAAWIFGVDFDQDFKSVKDVLEDYNMDTGMKAEWLWIFIEETVSILEDGL